MMPTNRTTTRVAVTSFSYQKHTTYIYRDSDQGKAERESERGCKGLEKDRGIVAGLGWLIASKRHRIFPPCRQASRKTIQLRR